MLICLMGLDCGLFACYLLVRFDWYVGFLDGWIDGFGVGVTCLVDCCDCLLGMLGFVMSNCCLYCFLRFVCFVFGIMC